MPDAELIATLNAARKATLAKARVVNVSAVGKAVQAVGQSSAIAVQDATTYLRNVETISATAYGVAMGLIVAGQDDTAKTLINQANKIVTNAATDFKTIGLNAAAVLRAFAKI